MGVPIPGVVNPFSPFTVSLLTTNCPELFVMTLAMKTGTGFFIFGGSTHILPFH